MTRALLPEDVLDDWWPDSLWIGRSYERNGRTVTLAAPSWIFRCPLCEYRSSTRDERRAREVRRIHARTAHLSWFPRHLDRS